ncbi:MAG: hypothetical protein ACLPXZ_10390 [Mycobacterium sp.]
MTVTVQRHRVVTLGSGYGRLTATKTLKHADHPDLFTFLLRIVGRGTADVHSHTTLWLQVLPPTAAVLTAAGALVTFGVAIIRDRNTIPRRQRYEISTAAEYFSYNEDPLGKVGTNHAYDRIA